MYHCLNNEKDIKKYFQSHIQRQEERVKSFKVMARESLTANTLLVLFVIAFCGVFTVLLAQWHQDTHHHHQADKFTDTQPVFQIGDICPDCPASFSKNYRRDTFCNSDFAMVIWIEEYFYGPKTTNETPQDVATQTIRSTNHIHFQELNVFKNKKMIDTKSGFVKRSLLNGRAKKGLRKEHYLKRNQVMIVNSTRACNMNILEENTAYFVTGRYIDKTDLSNGSRIDGDNRSNTGLQDPVMIISPCDLIFNWSDLSMERRQDLSDYFKSSSLCYEFQL